MARVRLCVCGSWFVGREGQAAHPRAPGQCLHFECRGAPARVRVWRCEGRPPLPHHFVCVEKSTLPYLTPVVEHVEGVVAVVVLIRVLIFRCPASSSLF